MVSLYLECRLRLLAACVLSTLISSMSLFGLFCMRNAGLSFPWYWCLNAIVEIFSFSNLLVFALNSCCSSMLAIICASKLTVTDRTIKKYYQLWTAYVWGECHFIIATTILVVFNGYIVLNAIGSYGYTSVFDESQAFSINQKVHCLLTFFAFIGFCFGVVVLIFNRTTLNFSQRRNSLSEIVWDHSVRQCLSTIGRILYFIPIYCMFANPFSYAKHLTLFGMFFDLRILILMFATGVHLQLSCNCTIDILKWQFMKNLKGPLTSPLEPDESVLGVLKSDTNPFLKHLAIERLADLVASSQTARADIFALNELGGTAPHWQEVYIFCITVLRRFISCTHWVNSFHYKLSPTDIVSRIMDPTPTHFSPTSAKGELGRSPRLRRLTPFGTPHSSIRHNPDITPFLGTQADGQVPKLNSQSSFRLPFLETEIPLASTANLFATGGSLIDDIPRISDTGAAKRLAGVDSGQVIIWATEILACLTLSAYTEDAYGSVQRSLGQILTAFVEALEAVERHLQLVGQLRHTFGPGVDRTQITSSHIRGADIQMVSHDPDQNDVMTAINCDEDEVLVNGRRDRTVVTDVRSLSYYRFASDPTLPWRLQATLTWAVGKCMAQYGGHLESMQLDRRSLDRLLAVRRNLSVVGNET